MTILSAKNTPRNTYTATAGQTAFTIGFEFFSVNDVKVYKNGTLMTYDASASTNTTYKITGTASASDDAYEFGAGGTVTFGSGVALNDSIVIIRDITIERTTDFNPSGAFDISTLNTQLDTIMSIMADTQEQTNRSVKLSDTDVTSATVTLPTNADRASKVLSFDASGNAEATLTTTGLSTLSGITSDITTVAGIASDVTTVSGISANVTTVAGISGNVTTVAGISSDVTTTAGISSNVTTVAGLSTEITALSGVSSSDLVAVAALGTELATLSPIASDITTVAGVSGNVTTVAGISSDVSTVSGISANTTTVAGISSNVTTVAGISSDVSTVAGISANVTTVAGDTTNIGTVAGNTTNINTVATNITDVNTFANKYRIAATDPTTSLDVGDLYYDTTNDIMKVYGSSGWQNAGSSINGTSARFQYVVSSSTTTLTGTDANGETLLYDPVYVDVYLNGVKMVNGTDVTVTSGTSVVFASAIGTSGTDYVDIIGYGTFNVASIATSSITSGTLGYARGGTGLGALGSADEVLQMNSGGTALEYGKVQAGNLDVAGNGTSGQMLTSDGDGTFSWADAPSGFSLGTALTGSTPTIDWSSATAFTHTLSADTTYSYSNIPTGGAIELYLKNVGEKTNYLNPTYYSSYVATSDYTDIREVHSAWYNNDGSKFYIVVTSGTSTYVALQYSLSTNYDITTASYDSVSLTLSGATTNLRYGHNYFFDNGTKLASGSQLASDTIVVHNLSTAYDISTLSSTASASTTLTSLISSIGYGTYFNSSMYRFDSTGENVIAIQAFSYDTSTSYSAQVMSFSLSTPYDITSTKTLTGSIQSLQGGGYPYTDQTNYSLQFISEDGKYIFQAPFAAIPPRDYNIWIWEMTTPFDLTTNTYLGRVSYPVQSSSDTEIGAYDPRCFLPSPDGRFMNMWWLGTSSNSYLQSETWRVFKVLSDYQITFPAVTSSVPTDLGTGADPATTSYLRMVSLDGTNVLITDHREIN